MREVKPTEKKKQEQTDEALAEMMLLIAAGKEG